jgi:manganese/zinc/iron transport system permease protein
VFSGALTSLTVEAIATLPGERAFSWADLRDVLLLADFNTRLVVLATTSLGVASGLVGSFLLLRKRALMGDALSHAMLPGIALAFIVMALLGGSGKFLPGLLLGAACFGLLGVGSVLLIRNTTRLQDDAALGIVLSVFFGLGIALLGLVQDMPQGSAAGLESFIYGKAASIVKSDLRMISTVAIIITLACTAFFKEFRLLCFDEGYARALGWPATMLDVLMLTLVTAVTVIGLQAVGLILMIAMLIIPAAAARFWTERLSSMLLVAAVIGGVSGWLGSSISALTPRLPAGAVIVLVCAGAFAISMICGSSRGVLLRVFRHASLSRRIGRQHVLRALYEILEADPVESAVTTTDLLRKRSWSAWELRRHLAAVERAELVRRVRKDSFTLTGAGRDAAERVVRNHRLWELYLITHADIAPSHVDRDADSIEHVLDPRLVAELERALDAQGRAPLPHSPHALAGGALELQGGGIA